MRRRLQSVAGRQRYVSGIRTSLFVGLGVWVMGSTTPAHGISLNQLTDVTGTLDQVVTTTADGTTEAISSSKAGRTTSGNAIPLESPHRKARVTAEPSRQGMVPAVTGESAIGPPLEPLELLSTPQLTGSIMTARHVTAMPLAAVKRSSGTMPLQASEAGWRVFGVPWYGWLAGGMGVGWGARRALGVLSRRPGQTVAAE